MSYQHLIKKAFKAKKPFVAYRNPNENKLQLLIQDSDELTVFDNFSNKGYVFAPFDDRKEAYLIKPDFFYTAEVDKTNVDLTESKNKSSLYHKENHVSVVNKAIKTIKESELSKVVIARKEIVDVSDFDLLQVYNRLLYKYTNAYVYVWFHPKVGLWMGATPEILLRIKDGNFNTMALAGTQPFKGDLSPTWGQKELVEQQMVADYIRTHLQTEVDNLHLSDVETVKAGNLLHLKTQITGTIRDVKDLELLVNLLHPTPAVCGMPKELSKQFILEQECFNRSFYSGYLGVLNIDNETSFFVNLRCFELIENKAHIYVGGGITKDSNAIKEWEETVAKSSIIKSVL